jgi:aspartate aminotransferase-like enzyme
MAFLSVSERAWQVIDEVDYAGYDALKPFQTAQQNFYFPYTPYWQGMAALHKATELLLQEGLDCSYDRHEKVAAFCRENIRSLGLSLFPAPDAIPSPTVTAVKVPEGISWSDLDGRLRSYGLVVGGSYGPLTGKVFRLGHMGTQADLALVEQALDAIRKSL